ncbi:MAG TPA: hypothetical protein DCQ58_10755 [Saprospirales bacterium]|nr:hypothetical protein [Saprospirales bacterium]
MFGVRYISDRKQVENNPYSTRIQPVFNPYSTRIQPVFNKYYLDLKTIYSGGSRDGCWTILRFADNGFKTMQMG